jgi:retinol dehydrogenase 12
MNYELSGKTVVVTGATSGIGLAVVRKFTQHGAFVIGVGRSETRNQDAFVQLSATKSKGEAVYLLCDLADQQQIKMLSKAIHEVLKKRQRNCIDILVNNAGVYLEKKQLTNAGIEKTFAVNHLAPFILTHELIESLQKSDQGRVMTVSSYSHRTTPLNLNRIANPKPYIGLLAYKRSKLCNILFTHALNSKVKGITAFAADPGLVNTGIASKGSQGISHWVWRSRRQKGTSPEIPATNLLFLAGAKEIEMDQGYYFKDCEPIPASPKSQRDDLAERLWALSCRLTGVC